MPSTYNPLSTDPNPDEIVDEIELENIEVGEDFAGIDGRMIISSDEVLQRLDLEPQECQAAYRV